MSPPPLIHNDYAKDLRQIQISAEAHRRVLKKAIKRMEYLNRLYTFIWHFVFVFFFIYTANYKLACFHALSHGFLYVYDDSFKIHDTRSYVSIKDQYDKLYRRAEFSRSRTTTATEFHDIWMLDLTLSGWLPPIDRVELMRTIAELETLHNVS